MGKEVLKNMLTIQAKLVFDSEEDSIPVIN
ncbi:MAG: hypothetical protein PWP45_1021 [Tepidanaerobacteraceae bacterium]|nr:hypothetical protein [Tepidanaerobacteraceae bacterium]